MRSPRPTSASTWAARSTRRSRLLHSFFIEGYLRALLQLPADRAVTSRDHFIAGLNAALDLGVSVVGDASRHFRNLRLVAFFQEDDLDQLFALFFLRRFLRTLVDELRVVVAFVALRHLLPFLFYFFWTQITLARANRHCLHRHGYDVLYLIRVNVGGTAQRRLQL